MLNELDKELTRRGHPFVRYADDGLIFCRSRRAAERVKESITRFIETKLHLRVNREKTSCGCLCGMKFLGYTFYRYKGECRLRIHPQSVLRMKSRLRELTSRRYVKGYSKLKTVLSEYMRGWLGYFKLADMKSMLTRIDEWLRRRIRMCIWKWWKRVRTRYKNLRKCGIIDKERALTYANARQGYWHMSSHPILHETISNSKLRIAGYPSMLDYYRKMTS